MAEEKLEPEIEQALRAGIAAVRKEEYLIAFHHFAGLYSGGFIPGTAEGLSYYGLTLALLNKKYKEAVELCTKAIKLQLREPNHYVNLAKVFVAAENRKKAVQTLEAGLKRIPNNKIILSYWKTIGVRAKPTIPFLARNNPINVALGRKRASRTTATEPSKKK